MKIALLHTDFRIYWPPRIKALHAFLKEMGHSLVVIEIAGKGSPYAFAGHSDISDFPEWTILFPDQKIEEISALAAKKAIYQRLDLINPDVLLSGALAFYSGATAIKWAGKRNKPLVIFDNARLQDVPRNLLINLIKIQLYRLADALYCPAPSHATSYKYWGFRDESIFYGLNCVDNHFFKELSQQNNLQGTPPHLPKRYFLSVGRQTEKKNLVLLLKAYKQYLKETKEDRIALVMIGEGSQNHLLRLLAGDLIDRLVFFLPFLSQEELVPIYFGCTAYVLPSLYGETWGLTVNEAMACGKAVVVSDQCGCAETLMYQGVNGWKFDPKNEEELTTILLEIGSMPHSVLKGMGQKSEEIIADWGLENFSLGIWQSINYAFQRAEKRNKSNLVIPRLLSHLWYGRFRPEKPEKKRDRPNIKHLVVLHTDLRIYWRSRLLNLQNTLKKIGIKLDIIEIAGTGSPYAFEKSGTKKDNLSWHILFPGRGAEEIPSPKSQQAIRQKLKELNPDVVVAGALAFQSGIGALKWKSTTGNPVVIFDDARPVDVKRNLFINQIKRIFYKNVDAIFCPAPSHAREFKRWGLIGDEIFYGVDVVDNELFENSALKNQGSFEAENIRQPWLLAVGRQIEKKNFLKLLNAFVRYKNASETSSLKLVFIGDGPLHQALLDIAEAAKRKDVIFVPFVQQDTIVQYYHQSMGLILPSRYGETWGLVVNEAMAAGLPVLVSRECGCSETLVRERENGWTFDPDNLDEIAAAIGKLDKLTAETWTKMGQVSTEIIRDWDLSRFTQGILDALVYITTKGKIKSNWPGRFLLLFWKGRYRPV